MEFDFDLENPFSTSIHNFPLLFHIENDHTPSKSYLQSNPSSRSQILSLILYFCRNFDVFSSYLAINYMDRFLSTTSIPVRCLLCLPIYSFLVKYFSLMVSGFAGGEAMDSQTYCCFLHFISIKDEENRILCFSFSGISADLYFFFFLFIGVFFNVQHPAT